MPTMEILRVNHLADGRKKLSSSQSKIIIVNSPSSVRSYGVFAVINILEKLKKEFSIVENFMIDCDNDLACLVTLEKLKLSHKIIVTDKISRNNLQDV